MEYKIVRYSRTINESVDEAISAMEIIVGNLLADGWQLLGGITVDNGVMYQAMIRSK